MYVVILGCPIFLMWFYFSKRPLNVCIYVAWDFWSSTLNVFSPKLIYSIQLENQDIIVQNLTRNKMNKS